MALRLLGSKLPQALPRQLVKRLPPLAKTTAPLVGEFDRLCLGSGAMSIVNSFLTTLGSVGSACSSSSGTGELRLWLPTKSQGSTDA